MNPLVSVIIPVYNVKSYLREAIDSVIGQTYRNIEIIIVDDGSTDGSESICDIYKSDSRVTVIHQENRGLSGARNTGLGLYKGDYLCFLDSDDAYHPAFIETLLNNALSTQTDMVACKYMVQKTTTQKLGIKESSHMTCQPNLSPGIYNREEALRSLVEGDLNIFVWNKLYKGNLWNDVRFPDGHNYEDMDTTYRVVNACHKISMVDEVLLFYRDRIGSITHNYSAENIRDWMLARVHFEAFIQLHCPETFDYALVARYNQDDLYAYMKMYANCFKDKDLCNELREIILTKGRKIDHWNIQTRMMYLMVRFMPSFFRCAYKIYRSFRLIIWKVTRR